MSLWRTMTTRFADNVTRSLRESFTRVTQPYLVENAAVLRMACDRDPTSSPERTNEEMTSKSDVHDQVSQPNSNGFSAKSARATTTKNTFQNSSSGQEARHNYNYPTPILLKDIMYRFLGYDMTTKKQYNYGLLALGVSNCLSYIANVCRYEGHQRGLEVISIGSDDGLVDSEIIENHRWHFGKDLDIISVNANPNPKREIQYKTVDELIVQRPFIVNNCILLLIWPEFAMEEGAKETELHMIRKLQPRTVLTVYEARVLCGSDDFRAYMGGEQDYAGWDRYENKSHGLENYSIEEIASQAVNIEAGKKLDWLPVPAAAGWTISEYKIAKLTRNGSPGAEVSTDASEVSGA